MVSLYYQIMVISLIVYMGTCFSQTDLTEDGWHEFTLTVTSRTEVIKDNVQGFLTGSSTRIGSNGLCEIRTKYYLGSNIQYNFNSGIFADVKILYSTWGYSSYVPEGCSFHLRVSEGWGNPQGSEFWNGCSNLPIVAENLAYGDQKLGEMSINNYIGDLLSQNKYIVAISDNENWANSMCSLDFTITGRYFVTPTTIKCTVKNIYETGHVKVALNSDPDLAEPVNLYVNNTVSDVSSTAVQNKIKNHAIIGNEVKLDR